MEGILDFRLPSPHLREYVSLLQIVGCELLPEMDKFRVKACWPKAENSLAFYPKDVEEIEYNLNGIWVKKPRSTINGQYSFLTNRLVGFNFMVFQIKFQPGALFRLTGLPSLKYTNSYLDAEDLFSNEIKYVNERLCNTKNYQDMIPIVEDFIQYLINRKNKKHSNYSLKPIDKVSRFIVERPSEFSLDWLADQACLSQKQFYRQFIEREGISPKIYARIARFDNVIKSKNNSPEFDWLSVALKHGYYDYQHLVCDFKDFTSLSPNQFLQLDGKSPERAFGMAET